MQLAELECGQAPIIPVAQSETKPDAYVDVIQLWAGGGLGDEVDDFA